MPEKNKKGLDPLLSAKKFRIIIMKKENIEIMLLALKTPEGIIALKKALTEILNEK